MINPLGNLSRRGSVAEGLGHKVKAIVAANRLIPAEFGLAGLRRKGAGHGIDEEVMSVLLWSRLLRAPCGEKGGCARC